MNKAIDKDDLRKQILENLSTLINLTPTGPERNLYCDVTIALEIGSAGTRITELPEFELAKIGEWKEVNQHQFMDNSGFSYHLMVPTTTTMVVVCKDQRGRSLIVRPVKTILEYLNFKHTKLGGD